MGAPTPAIAELLRLRVDHRLHHFDHDSGTARYGVEAARALGVEPGRVLKTLVGSAGSALVVAVVPVDGTVDLRALAAAMGIKRVELAEPAVAERATGYVIGGISPIGQRRRLPTLIDDSASGWSTVFVSAGRRGLDVEVSPADLAAVTGARFASIASRTAAP